MFDVVVLGLGAALVLAWAVAYVTLRLANYANSQGDDDDQQAVCRCTRRFPVSVWTDKCSDCGRLHD